MVKTVLSQDGRSLTILDQALANAFGNRGLVHGLSSNSNPEVKDDVLETITGDEFIKETSESITKALQFNIPNLVSFSRSLVDQFPWERDSNVELLEQDQSTCEVNFYILVKDFIGHHMTTLLMGESFVEAFPGVLQQLWVFDDNFVPMFVGFKRWVPAPGISSGHAARQYLLHVMSIFFRAFSAWDDGIDPGIELRELDDVSEIVKQRMRTFRKLDLSPRASAAATLSLYWELMEYIVKMTFWNVMHIFSDETLLEELRKEIHPYAESSRASRQETGFPFDEPPKLKLDMENLESCPLLNACHYETIRLHSAGITYRELGSDLTLKESTGEALEPRTYKISKGAKVIMPHGVIHNDSKYFSNPTQYKPERFITTDTSGGPKRANPDLLGPFAEGLYGPKNNKFTQRTILAFTASIVSMWNVSSADGKKLVLPRSRKTWGTFRPSSDIKVRVKARV